MSSSCISFCILVCSSPMRHHLCAVSLFYCNSMFYIWRKFFLYVYPSLCVYQPTLGLPSALYVFPCYIFFPFFATSLFFSLLLICSFCLPSKYFWHKQQQVFKSAKKNKNKILWFWRIFLKTESGKMPAKILNVVVIYRQAAREANNYDN